MRVYRCFAFVDLSGFTALTDHEGDERAVAVLSQFRAILREVCSRRGVRIDKWLGDGAMLVSVQPMPLLASLLDFELAISRSNLPLRVRCGADDGEGILISQVVPNPTTDVAIVLRTGQVTNRYLRHYLRPRAEPACSEAA